MGLAYNKLDVTGSTMWSYLAGVQSDLFRLASGWMLSRQEMIRLINGLLTGPSTTPQRQMAENKPLFWKPLQYHLMIRNPTNVPVRFKLYKCTLLNDDVGGTIASYTENTNTFNVGPNYMGSTTYDPAGNYPGSSHWKFWSQRGQYGVSANSIITGAYAPFARDFCLTQNDGADGPMLAPTGDDITAAAASGLTAHTCFEGAPTPDNDARLNRTAFLHRRAGLTQIFPAMRKQLSVKVVASGRLRAFQARPFRFSHRMPRMMRPLEYILNDTALGSANSRQFMKGLSHFFVIRAYCPPPLNTTGESTSAFPTQWSAPSPQLICDWRKSFQCRIADDAVPSYLVAYDGSSTGSYLYMNPLQGGFRNGFRYEISGNLAANTVVPDDQPDPPDMAYVAPSIHRLIAAEGPLISPSAANPLYLN